MWQSRWPASSQPSQVETGDFTQAREVDLSVDGRRVGAPMAEVIADVLQRPAFAEQSYGTGMAQRVRSMMPSPGTGGQQRGTGDVPQPGARDRPVRGERGEKDLSPPHLR